MFCVLNAYCSVCSVVSVVSWQKTTKILFYFVTINVFVFLFLYLPSVLGCLPNSVFFAFFSVRTCPAWAAFPAGTALPLTTLAAVVFLLRSPGTDAPANLYLTDSDFRKTKHPPRSLRTARTRLNSMRCTSSGLNVVFGNLFDMSGRNVCLLPNYSRRSVSLIAVRPHLVDVRTAACGLDVLAAVAGDQSGDLRLIGCRRRLHWMQCSEMICRRTLVAVVAVVRCRSSIRRWSI